MIDAQSNYTFDAARGRASQPIMEVIEANDHQRCTGPRHAPRGSWRCRCLCVGSCRAKPRNTGLRRVARRVLPIGRRRSHKRLTPDKKTPDCICVRSRLCVPPRHFGTGIYRDSHRPMPHRDLSTPRRTAHKEVPVLADDSFMFAPPRVAQSGGGPYHRVGLLAAPYKPRRPRRVTAQLRGPKHNPLLAMN